jgi:hypothetical protein
MKKHVVLFCAAGLAAILAACSPAAGGAGEGAVVQAEISLPEFPAGLPPLDGWLLVTGSGGKAVNRFVPSGTRSVTVEVRKNAMSPVLAYPLSTHDAGGVSFFLPAGCVYPISTDTGWKEGFEAEVMLSLLVSGVDVSHFNWKRLHDLIASVENPWNMDKAKIMSQIGSKSFSIYSVKEQKSTGEFTNSTGGVLFDSFVPSGGYEDGGVFLFYPTRDNRVFDGENVFLVCPPQASGGTGQTAYSLALMPLTLYLYAK